MFTIAHERPEHGPSLQPLLDAAFGPGRLGKRSYHFREGVEHDPDLAFVALIGRRVVGTIRFWPILVGREGTPALLLGPLAVLPALKGRGIGRALVRYALNEASLQGHRAVLLVGDPAYYRVFGFEPAADHGLAMPGEDTARLQVMALAPDGLADFGGEVRRAAPPTYARSDLNGLDAGASNAA
ncbi:GNAT family N-acetyltransferase [Marinivivus vitaminiproducens]|uniref:GNAT family N-acetyltransferase n=1 Tax=Marinivivus vitaminiproducens TaxID=3035935 RepID=UPI0027A06478|nr:N-acetyltransferase [Geminicoccaceae bacterium SCSIO 64248]